MGFEALLGNEQLKENLTGSLRRGHVSHFYLISGPAGSGKHTLAKLLAAAILCGKDNAPCTGCSTCRKVFEGNHPDFITVTDPEHKNIAVKIGVWNSLKPFAHICSRRYLMISERRMMFLWSFSRRRSRKRY